jgi:hypothetical protein
VQYERGQSDTKETFEWVTEHHGGKTVPVKHFYRRHYQIAGGDWRMIYHAIFTDTKGKRRKMPACDRVGGKGVWIHDIRATFGRAKSRALRQRRIETTGAFNRRH